MRRVVLGAAIVVAVGIVAFSVYNRTDAEAPATAISGEVTSPCGSCDAAAACGEAVSAEKSASCAGGSASRCQGSPGCLDGAGVSAASASHPECTCPESCKNNPDCKCPTGCKGNAECTCPVHCKGTCPGHAQAQAEPKCGAGCQKKCGGKKAATAL